MSHPNDKEPCTPACRKALDAMGDDTGQGLDDYWKWAFKSGYNRALADAIASAAQPVQGETVQGLTEAQCEEFRRLPVSFNDMVRAIYQAGTSSRVAELEDALREVLKTHSEEARTHMAAENAISNFSNCKPEVEAAKKAAFASSAAEKHAREVLSKGA